MLQWVDTLIGLVVILLAVSLIITILNQIIIALLNLRGRNLRKGIQLLLENVDTKIAGDPKELSKKILTHPLLSDKLFNLWPFSSKKSDIQKSGLRYATAISKTELINILELENVPLKGYRYETERKINEWFDTVMKRTSQLFAQNTRIMSVVFAIILSFLLHLNFFSLFHQISNDADLRESLVASSSTLLNQAGTVIGTPSVYAESISQLISEDTSAVNKKLEVPPDLNNRTAAENWIRTKLGEITNADTLIKKYDKILTVNLDSSLMKLAGKAGSILDSLNKSNVQIIPQPKPDECDAQYYGGVLIMAGFLSLGAPFWFKALKTLSALRPVIAGMQDKEK